jgi:hypothetical protein
MSKTFRSFLPIVAAALLIFQPLGKVNAQDIVTKIIIDEKEPTAAYIEGTFVDYRNDRNLSFLRDFGGSSGLTQRFSNLQLFGANNVPVLSRKMIDGEYLAEGPFSSWSYRVDLRSLQNSSSALVSWLGNKGGILMLNDILPQTHTKTSTIVSFSIPLGWQIATTEPELKPSTYEVKNLAEAVFYVGPDHRQNITRVRGSQLTLNITDNWLFSEDDAASTAASVFGEYERLFGSAPSERFVVGIRKFPNPIAVDNWEAGTRGRTVTIVSSETAFESQSLQRLHEQLRHEIFHFWIPNGVNLSGNYDWFYEGFALYQSLKTGVALNRIRFDDYLDTLSRAYQIDKTPKLSLIEASKNRWAGNNNTQIYARGMLVAFMCDLALLEKSKGKRSVTDLLRQLYQRHQTPNPEMDGNRAVLDLLRSYSELPPIIDRNITGSDSIEWNDLLKGAGLEAEPKSTAIKLKVIEKPSGRQKDLLDKLGYNNWRKLASK